MVELNREFLVKKYGKENLFNLTKIELNGIQITKIDSNTFKNLIKLERLWLHDNAIEEIDVRLFESIPNLKHLSLSGNKLKRIDSNTFKNLTKLEVLWLHYNAIEEIDLRLFESLSNLKELYLYSNKLKRIDQKCFEPLKSIESVILYENIGLNVLSFVKQSKKIWNDKVKEKLEKYGSIPEWNEFLQQFPDIGKRFQDPYIGEFLNDRYQVVNKIGKGSFGSVYLVDDTKINIKKVKQKAMKIMDKLDSATENELELFSEINHENIVRYFDHFHMSIKGENKTFLITEYCENGDLKNQIEEAQLLDRNFDDRQILNWICQATNALKYLHSKKPDPIIHRDIKPANMLLTERNEIKLGDLGLSKIMDNTHASSYTGSPAYMSPEVFKEKYYPNTDIWSLGCVLYELKFLKIAFPRGQFSDPPIPSNVSSSGIFSSILPKMLEKDCLVRITSRRLLVELEDLLEDENHSKF